MAKGPVQCFLGFSTTYTNGFSEHLERRAAALERHHREANGDFLFGLKRLHDAVDAALANNADGVSSALANGLDLLGSCNDHLTAIGEALVRTRSELFEQEGVDRTDPLIAREPFFAAIDVDAMYRELAAHGAALPQRVFWDNLAGRVRDGGARAGLRLLDRHLRELQSDLRTFVGEVESMRRLPLAELGPTLHNTSRAVGAITVGFMRLLTAFLYFSMICERASQLYEQATGSEPAELAAAG